ncbi:LysR family transcriptional regulator [Methylobacterium soli]|uniref:LysR family transcriptional regulator n=1 Tax=Methylobacterium soli TaxID=553447 RepID=A0A6L3SPR0_9HYPH|nr:LysR family transcriptional regulator [Methylobacterium soli]KAB1072068.1 LysR family transcriptional regulator [Methylobacterium soli]GJE43765.1 HTH-type transcriptional regulator HdfR [Methylobacterium soli]
MPNDTNWDHLRSLLAFARAGTFTAAAKTLGVKHSTVSRHLSDLEQQIRSKIVYRDVDGPKLTLAGERLAVSAELMETHFRQAQDDIAGRDSLVSGAVRIGAPDGFGAMFLAPRLSDLADRFPSLEVQLVAMPRVFNLTNREADIAVSLTLPDHGRVIGRKLSDYSLGLYASEEYIRKTRPILKISDLHDHRFVNYIEDLIAINELDYLEEVSKDVSATFQSSSIIAQANATVSGFGLCVLPYFIALPHSDLVRVLPCEINLTRTWYVLTHETQKDLGKIRAVSDFIVSIVQQAAPKLIFP